MDGQAGSSTMNTLGPQWIIYLVASTSTRYTLRQTTNTREDTAYHCYGTRPMAPSSITYVGLELREMDKLQANSHVGKCRTPALAAYCIHKPKRRRRSGH
jgi:hypothetical protein